jgi:O-antigen/teichoic acid export membrane protein
MSLKKNIIAKYFGQGWRAAKVILFVPLYIKYLGVEAYGLIGIFAMVQVWLSLLDVGMKPALGREKSRFSGGALNVQSIWDLLRSIEIVSIFIALSISLIIWSASRRLATDWANSQSMPVDIVAIAFSLMGLVTALQFIESIYTSSLGCNVRLCKIVL